MQNWHVIHQENLALNTTLFFPVDSSSNFISSVRTHSICQMQATSSGLYPGSKRKRKIQVVLCLRPPQIIAFRFHVVVVHWTSKKYTKKRHARAELWVCSIVFYVVVVILFVSQLIALADNAVAFLRDVIISGGD